MFLCSVFVEQEQQCVAVGPGNTHFIFVHQVSSTAATLQRRHLQALLYGPPLLLLLLLLCIGNLMNKNYY